jgi:hypothetical protein
MFVSSDSRIADQLASTWLPQCVAGTESFFSRTTFTTSSNDHSCQSIGMFGAQSASSNFLGVVNHCRQSIFLISNLLKLIKVFWPLDSVEISIWNISANSCSTGTRLRDGKKRMQFAKSGMFDNRRGIEKRLGLIEFLKMHNFKSIASVKKSPRLKLYWSRFKQQWANTRLWKGIRFWKCEYPLMDLGFARFRNRGKRECRMEKSWGGTFWESVNGCDHDLRWDQGVKEKGGGRVVQNWLPEWEATYTLNSLFEWPQKVDLPPWKSNLRE